MARPYNEDERKKLKKTFLKHYEESLGLQYLSAKKAKVSVQTINTWRKNDPEFDEAIKDIDERVAENVVGILMQNVMAGDRASIFFWLKCKRHWSETHKVEVENKNAIDINAVINEMKDELINE